MGRDGIQCYQVPVVSW